MSLLHAEQLAIAGRLQPTSLALDAGTLACLVGPNGSGKTSLLHALAGIGFASGEVRVDGHRPEGLKPNERQRLIGFLPASREIAWPLTAADLIALGHGGNEAEAVRALALEPFLDRRMDRLSTGERTRVLLARLLAAGPRLLLLDEPVANLDPLWQLMLMDYLKALVRRTGQSVLMAVHDLDIARRHSDRVVVMAGGAIAADDEPATIFDGGAIARVFGVERGADGWQAVRPPERLRSSP